MKASEVMTRTVNLPTSPNAKIAPRDCGPRYSTPGCMIARCAPDWPLSRPLQPIQQSPWPNPSGPLKPP